MSIYATQQSKVYVGQVQASQSTDFVESDFDSHSWVEISWLESIGAFGDESSEITFDAIGEGRTQKIKGVRNAGNMELVCGIDWEDAGQNTLRGAQTEIFDYAFKVQFNDAPSGGTPSLRYFIGKIMTAREELGVANNVMKLNATIGINSNVVNVSAAA